MDGLAVCALKASAVEGGALSFEDVSPGQLLSGTVDGVEDFGVFVKLAAGLKCAPGLPDSCNKISAVDQTRMGGVHAASHLKPLMVELWESCVW